MVSTALRLRLDGESRESEAEQYRDAERCRDVEGIEFPGAHFFG